jgi:pyruvate kinase
VVVATQLMEGMINNSITTRAETNDVANAVFDGADALMLSGETAIGKYPTRVVKAMTKIILSVENSDFKLRSEPLHPQKKSNPRYISDSICFYACKIADETQAKAIITLTHSGYNAQKICANRPKSFIYVFTHNMKILNALNLLWGVYAFYYTKFNSTDETIKDLHKLLIRQKFIKKGDTVINIGSMPIKEKGMTNMLKLNTVH